jgi:TIR domain
MHTFISYSRTQQEFANRLAKALLDRNQPVWVDTQGILPAEPWGPAIKTAIIDAEHFLLILNEDWLRSKVCQEELEVAVEHGKKLITVVVPEHDQYSFKLQVENDGELGELLPPQIKSRNYIWSQERDLKDIVESILLAVVVDFDWNRIATRVQRRAVAWEASGKRHSLLRGDELLEARQAFDNSDGKQPQPTKLALEFLQASEDERDAETALAAAWSDWNEGRVGRAIDATLRAWQLTEESGHSATHAHVLMSHRVIECFGGAHLTAIESAVGALDPKGKWVALGGGELQLWLTDHIRENSTGAQSYEWPEPSVTVRSAELQSIDHLVIAGDWLAAANSTRIGVCRLGQDHFETMLESDLGSPSSLRFSRDGQWLLGTGRNGSALWSLTRDVSTPFWRSSDDDLRATVELADGILVRHVKEPNARIEWAVLNPNATPIFDRVHVLREAAQEIALAPEGNRWAALCGHRVYMASMAEQSDPTKVIDLSQKVPVANWSKAIDGLSFQTYLERRPSMVKVRAFGFLPNDLVAIVVSVSFGGFFVIYGDRRGMGCDFADFSGSVVLAQIDGEDWVALQSNGAMNFGTWPTQSPSAQVAVTDAKLVTSRNTKALINGDGTMWFFRGEAEIVRRRSPFSESTLAITYDGRFVFQHSPTAVALWDVSDLAAKSIPKLVSNTGYLVTALATSRDSEIALGTGRTIISDLGGPTEHKFDSGELMQNLAKAEATGRWIGIDSGSSVQAWGGDLPEVSVRTKTFMDLPVQLVVSDQGNWAVFHSNRHATFFVDLDAQTALELRDDPSREMLSPILKGGLGGSSFLTGEICGSAHVWLASAGGPELLGRIPVDAGVLHGEALGVDEYVTVHADRHVYVWMIDRTREQPDLVKREVIPLRIEMKANLHAALFSANGEWLAFQEKSARGTARLYLVPTRSAHVISSVALADQAELMAVDDSGAWVLGREESGIWLYPSSPSGSHVAPIHVSDAMYGGFAKFLSNRGLVVGTNEGQVKIWPLHAPDISQRLATLRAILSKRDDGVI